MSVTVAEDIADYLASLGLGTKGTDIFQSFVRDEPGNAVLITEMAGQAAQRTHDMRRVRNPAVVIVVRDEVFDTGYQKMQEIYDAMLDLVNTGLNGNTYLGAIPIGDISDLGRDERDRFKWSARFVVKKS